eukprot:1742962-Prymnesium_polylepis.2
MARAVDAPSLSVDEHCNVLRSRPFSRHCQSSTNPGLGSTPRLPRQRGAHGRGQSTQALESIMHDGHR